LKWTGTTAVTPENDEDDDGEDDAGRSISGDDLAVFWFPLLTPNPTHTKHHVPSAFPLNVPSTHNGTLLSPPESTIRVHFIAERIESDGVQRKCDMVVRHH
jgi:hypothetical protein